LSRDYSLTGMLISKRVNRKSVNCLMHSVPRPGRNENYVAKRKAEFASHICRVFIEVSLSKSSTKVTPPPPDFSSPPLLPG
jgi:hypothetical protein